MYIFLFYFLSGKLSSIKHDKPGRGNNSLISPLKKPSQPYSCTSSYYIYACPRTPFNYSRWSSAWKITFIWNNWMQIHLSTIRTHNTAEGARTHMKGDLRRWGNFNLANIIITAYNDQNIFFTVDEGLQQSYCQKNISEFTGKVISSNIILISQLW